MTGVADLYLYVKQGRPKSFLFSLWKMICNYHGKTEATCFVVMAWKRTGSNLLCGILYHHPEIIMHNELFNTIDIFMFVLVHSEAVCGRGCECLMIVVADVSRSSII